MFNKIKKKTLRTSLQMLCVLSAALMVWGCGGGGGGGGSSYDTPADADNDAVVGAATNVLIDTDILAGWIKQGHVGNETGFDQKVVVLDYFAYTDTTATKRIKGACRVAKGDLVATRFEGVADATPLVASGAQMDAVIQRLGIDEDTIIVITTAENAPVYYATRAYWTLRYWGFPKENLRLLDGGNTAFAADYPALMTFDAPTPTPSTFSVRNLAEINDDLRASVGEMVTLIKTDLINSATDLVLDARGDSYYLGNKATSGLLGGDVVVVDGHPEGGHYLGQGGLFVDSDYTGGIFKSATDIEAMFAAVDADYADKKTTVYCTSGYSATPLFFVLDAILGADVQLYDGSWSQLGKYSEEAALGGELPVTSAWSIDAYLDPDSYTYNKGQYDDPLTIENLDAASAVAPQAAPFTGDVAGDSDVVQSQVEAADIAYAAGGGGTDFVAPVNTANGGDVLLSAATLESWVDAGYVNAAQGAERVVIIDVTSPANYAAAHVPGAQLWDYAGQAVVRTEGPAPAVNMMITGAALDTRLQALGVDEYTTIVITSSMTATYFPSRAYFSLRYWGVPKANIKVLNGYNNAWDMQADLTKVVPSVTASTFSVADLNAGAQLDTRVALAELMDAIRDDRGTPIDFRGDKSAIGSTPGVWGDSGDYVVFEGTLATGTSYSWKNFNVDYDGGDLTFEDAGTIAADMLAAGIDTTAFSNDGSYSDPIYSYCRTGYIASTGFFVLDGILGVDVMTYDGSWSQFGKMSDDAAKGGELADGSEWATDNATYMSVWNYNVDNTKSIEPLNADADALNLSPASANQVEDADYDYQILPPEDSGSEAPAAGDGGGSIPSIGC